MLKVFITQNLKAPGWVDITNMIYTKILNIISQLYISPCSDAVTEPQVTMTEGSNVRQD